MGSICIVTDGAAQFTQPGFAGRQDVRILPFGVQFKGQTFSEGEGPKTNTLPASIISVPGPRLLLPDAEGFYQFFQTVGRQYNEILVLLSAYELTHTGEQAEQAARAARAQCAITLVDSQTTSVGLGLLVQAAAEAATRGQSLTEIERLVRHLAGNLYSVFCLGSLSYLANSGFIDSGQALAGEFLNLLPIFSLEEGRLSAVEKVRNSRHALEYFQEFLGEFESLSHIAFIQGVPPAHEVSALRSAAQDLFPKTSFSEHSLSPVLASALGPKTLALFLLEAV
jgi:DegV family protein with EDD domain